MYYVIETKYVGPNQADNQYADTHNVEISTSPALTSSSREARLEGWCSTTNGWAVYAHGEYDTIEEARVAITEKFGVVRNSYQDGSKFEPASDDIAETYKPGKYELMSRQATVDWAEGGVQNDIKVDTTDERISELVTEYEAEANENGYTLDSDLESFMKEQRQDLRDI